jgi:LAO/AO transport system kinase
MAVSRTADPATLFDAARAGDRVALPRLLSLVERGGSGARAVAEVAYRSPTQAYTVGITGAPGAGKSTLTDQLITRARDRGIDGASPEGGASVAVLAIDPSSPFSGGAILGDRVRMQNHALDDRVFIRSMATRGHLGGLAVAVPDAVRVLSAVGLPVVLVETVGVGQQEVAVAAATDTTVVVLNPGWGDAIQANKAGLMEIADLFVINKADRPGTRETRRDLELMLDLTDLGDWRPPIVETVAQTGDGVDELWGAVQSHRDHLVASGTLETSRRERLAREFHQILVARVEERLADLEAGDAFGGQVASLAAGDLDPYAAADELLVGLFADG